MKFSANMLLKIRTSSARHGLMPRLEVRHLVLEARSSRNSRDESQLPLALGRVEERVEEVVVVPAPKEELEVPELAGMCI
jgi:hypothetical protein